MLDPAPLPGGSPVVGANPPTVRALVAEPRCAPRRSVARALRADTRVDVVASAGDAGMVLVLAGEHVPDVALLDVRFGRAAVLRAVLALATAALPTPTVLLGAPHRPAPRAALARAAMMCVGRDTPLPWLVHALVAAALADARLAPPELRLGVGRRSWPEGGVPGQEVGLNP